jgi:hypothetical protein
MSRTYSSLRVVGISATAASRSFILYASSSSCANTRRTQRNIPDIDQHFPTFSTSALLVIRILHKDRDKCICRCYDYGRERDMPMVEKMSLRTLRPCDDLVFDLLEDAVSIWNTFKSLLDIMKALFCEAANIPRHSQCLIVE